MLVASVRRHWIVAASVALVVLGAALLAVALLPRVWTSTAIVAVIPREGAEVSGELVRIAVPTYATLATSDTVARAVAESLDEDPDAVRKAISADLPPSTNTVLVSASWGEPERAAQIANGAVYQLLAFAPRDPLLAPFVVTTALPPTEPAFPPRDATLILGTVLALVLGGAAAVTVDRARRPAAEAA